MYMEGRRFTVGLVAGLLVALGVVTAAGSFGTSPASVLFGPTSGGAAVTSPEMATTTATASVTMGVTATTVMSATSSSAAVPNATNSSSQTYVVSVTTGATSTSSPATNGQSADTTARTPSFSSQLVNISKQPPLSNALILLPLLVAFLLGAVLYRASVRGRASSEEE